MSKIGSLEARGRSEWAAQAEDAVGKVSGSHGAAHGTGWGAIGDVKKFPESARDSLKVSVWSAPNSASARRNWGESGVISRVGKPSTAGRARRRAPAPAQRAAVRALRIRDVMGRDLRLY